MSPIARSFLQNEVERAIQRAGERITFYLSNGQIIKTKGVYEVIDEEASLGEATARVRRRSLVVSTAVAGRLSQKDELRFRGKRYSVLTVDLESEFTMRVTFRLPK